MSVAYVESDLKEPFLGPSATNTAEIREYHVFKVAKTELSQLFNYDLLSIYDIKNKKKISKSLTLLKRAGGTERLVTALRTNEVSGINGDTYDIQRRKGFFGKNERKLPQVKTFTQHVIEATKDELIRLLFYLATLTIIVAIFSQTANMGDQQYYLQAVAIYLSLAIVVCATAGFNHIKDKQFLQVISTLRKEHVSVFRGRDEFTHSVMVEDIVVGDIIFLTAGQRVPADCLVLKSFNLTVDESKFQGLKDAVKKDQLTEENFEANPNPFLFSQSIILSGYTKALVCSVGNNTYYSQQKERLTFEDQPTPTQQKLGKISKTIQVFGKVISYLVITVLLAHLFFDILFTENRSLLDNITLQQLLNSLSTGIALIVLSAPEGLPLAITLALAFQIKDKQSCVTNLAATEKMGTIKELLISKTGILTLNKDPKVSQFYIEGNFHDNDLPNRFEQLQLNKYTRDLFVESILHNTGDARVEMDSDCMYRPKGNLVDCGLLQLLLDNDIPVYQESRRISQESQLKYFIPFSSSRMLATSVVAFPEQSCVRVYCKGAPEVVIKNSRTCFDKNAQLQDIEDYQTMTNYAYQLAQDGSKPIALAFKDYSIEEFSKLEVKYKNFQRADDKEEIFEKGLTLIAMVAIQDKSLDDVKDAIAKCRESGITLRLVTSDNLAAAKNTAIDLGLISKAEASHPQVCMEGETFKEFVGGLKITHDSRGKILKEEVAKIFALQTACNNLRVLARCSPEVKTLLVLGLKEKALVALTGKGVDDIHSLEIADVRISHSSKPGSEIAKDIADIVLLEGTFNSIFNSLKWGRAIYANVRKFMQFQLTINIAAMILIFSGCVVRGESPLTPFHILWLNICIDTLGALALATESPSDSILKHQKPLQKDEKIFIPLLAKNIIIISIYCTIVLIILLFLGENLFDLPYDYSIPFVDYKVLLIENKRVHYTIIFHTLMMMVIFHEIACRKIADSELNIFDNLLNNTLFMLVIMVTLSVQFLFVQYGGSLVRCAPLTTRQHVICLLIGASVLIVSFLIKLINPAYFSGFQFDEDVEDIETKLLPKRMQFIRFESQSSLGHVIDGEKTYLNQSSETSREREVIKILGNDNSGSKH